MFPKSTKKFTKNNANLIVYFKYKTYMVAPFLKKYLFLKAKKYWA